MWLLFNDVIAELGRMEEERMTFESVIFLVRQTLLNKKVCNSVSNYGVESSFFGDELV